MAKPILLQPAQTLREILALEPRAQRIFEAWNVDYYCGGDRTLAEACGQTGCSLEELQASLNRLLENAVDYNEELEWYTASLKELSDHIVLKHHTFLRKRIPELLELAKKVLDIHGEEHPETLEVLEALRALREVLEPHLAKEEEHLFPFLCALEGAAEGRPETGPAGGPSLERVLPLVWAAHNHNNGLLKKIRTATRNYTPPEDACYSFQRLWKGLRELEKDMHHHLHLENNILLPRARDYENRTAASRPLAGP